MPFDPPSIGGYTLSNPPDMVQTFHEVVQQVNELADGSTRQRILGYRLRASLLWEEGWIRSVDLTGLMAVANDQSASITFLPRPVKFPTRSYAVMWTNKFTFPYWQGKYDVYAGSIDLVTPSVTSVVSDLP